MAGLSIGRAMPAKFDALTGHEALALPDAPCDAVLRLLGVRGGAHGRNRSAPCHLLDASRALARHAGPRSPEVPARVSRGQWDRLGRIPDAYASGAPVALPTLPLSFFAAPQHFGLK